MKKKSLICSMFILIPVLMLLVLYFVLAFYYRDSFSCGTWVNGIYCTGRSVEEINRELLAAAEFPDIVLVDRFGGQSRITMKEIDYKADYTEQLTHYRNKQNPFLWIDNLFTGRTNHLAPDIVYDEEKLAQALQELSIVKEEAGRERDIRIVWTEDGYVLQNGTENVLNEDSLLQAVRQGLSQEVYEINLEEAGCYEDAEPTAEMKAVLKLWEKVAAFQQCGITYDFEGEMVPVTQGDSSQWILTDEAGNFVLDEAGGLQVDEEAVAEYVSGLALKYDTYGKTREFGATCGLVVQIEGGTYGSQLNQTKETEYLVQAFAERVSEVHVPSYKREAQVKGEDDIGDTYIEIDLTDQKMFYYADGELVLETDVVTGNMKKGHDTPAGVNYVYAKQRNRTLRGADYESFVRYWMPVAGNIGIHDASWRSRFGGEIYKTNGSHGCINTPHSKMKELFDMVSIGVPVVMFYHD